MIVIIIVVSLYLLTACSERSGSTLQTQTITSGTQLNTSIPSISNNQSDISKDEEIKILKQIIISAISNDIWYKGNYSEFKGFISQESEIDIYTRPKVPNQMSIFFKKSLMGADNKEHFYVIDFWKGSRGYDNVVSGFFKEETYQNIEKRLNVEGYNYLEKSNIKLPALIQPQYPEMQSEEKDALKEMINKLPQKLKFWGLETGNYKIFVRKFSQNDYTTYVVIENNKGQNWLVDVDMSELGKAYLGKVNPLKDEAQKYLAEQYKKVSIEQTIVVN